MLAPRGVRNNNPGNLEGGVGYEGETGKDGRFAVFESSAKGLRAAARNIFNKRAYHGLGNIWALVGDDQFGWAPSFENNVSAYVATVSQASGFSPTQPLDFRRQDVNWRILKGIVRAENGQKLPGVEWYSDAELQAAAMAAGAY